MQERRKTGNVPVILFMLGIGLFFACICWTNIRHFNYKMNADIAAEVILASTVWETKDIHPDVWYFDSETKIFGTLDFAAVFYGLTHNMVLAQGLACCVMAAFLLLSIYCFGRMSGQNRLESMQFVLLGMIICVNPNILELVFLYACYYSLHTITLFITLGVYAESMICGKTKWMKWGGVTLLSFCLGVQGMRGTLVIYAPLFGIEAVRQCYRLYCKKRYDKADFMTFMWVIILLAVNYVGTLIPISIGYDVSRNIRKGFHKLYSVVLPEVRQMLGFEYMPVAGKVCLSILLLLTVWMLADILWRMCRKREIEVCEWCFLMLCASPVTTAFIVAFTTVGTSLRYYYIIFYAMAYAVVLAYRKCRRLWAGKSRYCGWIAGIMIITLAVCSLRTVYLPIFRTEEPPRNDWYQVVDYLEKNGLTRAYANFENAGTMTVIANGRVQMAAVDSIAQMNVCKWTTRKDWFVPYVPYEEKTAYVVTDSEIEDFAGFLTQHEDVTYAAKVGRFHIYVSPYNYARGEE